MLPTPPRIRRGLVVAAIGGLLLVLPSASAFAHGGGDSDQSRVLVIDALAYLANQPAGYMDNVTDKVNDALDAPDKDGVDLTKVAAAKQALDGQDMMQARTLLQESVQPMTDPIVGEDPGTTVMLDPMPGSTQWRHAGAIVLAAVCGFAILAGLWLARRWRPTDTVRQLRARLTNGKTS